MAEVVVELLTKAHDRKSFNSGAAGQNEFLRIRARKHAELGYSLTYVAVETGGTRILGFVTLSLGSIEFAEINEQISARLPRYPMPVVRLGQLATDREFQGRGIGRLLLRVAIEKTVEVAQQLGCHALVIEADNQKAYDWYIGNGFLRLSERAMRVYLPVETLKAAMDLAHPS